VGTASPEEANILGQSLTKTECQDGLLDMMQAFSTFSYGSSFRGEVLGVVAMMDAST